MVTTGPDGLFTVVNLTPGTHEVLASKAGYLSSRDSSVQCQADQTTKLPEITLRGGDTDNNKIVNLFDLVWVAGAYNTCSGDREFRRAADINETGCIDLFDLVLVGVNYNLGGPIDWSALTTTALTASAAGSAQDYLPAVREPGTSLFQAAEHFDVRVENVHGLYGIDVNVSFDASAVSIVDADPSRPGIQVEPGPLFAGLSYFPVKNEATVNEETGIGSITFVATLLHPAEPLAGSGTVITIGFDPVESQAPTGATAFTIEKAVLADQSGHRLVVEVEGNTIRQVFEDYMPLIVR
jgi:hypothetical protein